MVASFYIVAGALMAGLAAAIAVVSMWRGNWWGLFHAAAAGCYATALFLMAGTAL